jgi:hypothetical protein
MSYTQISTRDDDDHVQGPIVPSSPPPPFSSRAASLDQSRAFISNNDPLSDDAERTLAETFDSPSDDEEQDEDESSRRRLVPDSESNTTPSQPPVERRVSQYPAFAPTTTRTYGSGTDGVFANLSAKPSSGEDADEKPPVRLVSNYDYHVLD